MLVLITGLPATGKTHFAKDLALVLRAEHLNTDVVRKKCNMVDYTDEGKKNVYEKLFTLAEQALSAGKNVVVDGTFYKKDLRKQILNVAVRTNSEHVTVLRTLPESEVKKRLEARAKIRTMSDANFDVYQRIKKEFEEITDPHLVIGPDGTREEKIKKIMDYFKLPYMHGKGLLEKLALPASYDGQTEKVEFLQTHISNLFLTDTHVYKLKKPLKFSFLDFSVLWKRKLYCERELRLNKRLCPEIYLSVLPVTIDKNNNVKIGSTGEADAKIANPDSYVLDYAVKMLRIPENRKMNYLLESGDITVEIIEQIAKILSGFHSKADVIRNKNYGSAKVWSDIKDLESVKDTVEKEIGAEYAQKINGILEKCGSFIEENRNLFEKRVAKGRVKRCHGDVHSENIFLTDKIHIFDTIEFNEEFARIDVASEIAFMAMDLDFHNEKKFSKFFVDKYVEYSGDTELLKLLPLYKCYRSNVRAKVAALQLMQNLPPEEAENQREKCRKYLELTEEYAGLL